MKYIRLCKGLADRGKLVPENTNLIDATTRNDAWYRSLFLYDEKHKAQFDSSGSVAGITDVTTNYMFFDFDHAENLEEAKLDASFLIGKLTNTGIPKEDIRIFFSGKKGFSVELLLNKYLTNEEYKRTYFDYIKGLVTADPVVANPSRVIRIMLTKHNESGLYKIPLTYDEFSNQSANDIKQKAASLQNISPPSSFRWNTVSISVPAAVEVKPTVEVSKEMSFNIETLDFSKKPKFLNAATWAIQNGFFKEGERSVALTCLAATYRNVGFELEHTYRLLKGVAEIQSRRTGMDRFPDEEIYNNIILQVYGPNWRGGQYSLTDKTSWLYKYAEKYHIKDDSSKLEYTPRTLLDVTDGFKEYVKNIDKNTIKTGIKSLDEQVFLSTGANVLLVGAPGSGKTSAALDILENTSRVGIKSVFASLDMNRLRLMEKAMYRITGLPREQLYDKFRNNQEAPFMTELRERYENTFFFDKSAPTVQDIREYIIDCEQKSGEKVKFLMIDYFERLNCDKQDENAVGKQIAGEIQDLVNDLDLCSITLVQPNKQALNGDASTPITSYTAIKGSAFLYQSARIILSLWRPFYTIKHNADDRFMSMGILKNDLGEIGQLDFSWNGKRGEIKELDDFGRQELEDLLKLKEENKEEQSSSLMERFKNRK